MAEINKIKLLIDGKVFEANKNALCEHSDYFRAMFSGSYVEHQQNEIKIDVVNANSMANILQYINNGMIDLSKYPLSSMSDLALSANFLQITELIKQIEYILDIQLSNSNWIEIMAIAQIGSFTKLEKLAMAHGLLNFNSMKPEHIPSILKLAKYLSHPYLNTDSELRVFKFGLQWILDMKISADALLIILGCLDIHCLKTKELEEMKTLVKDFELSLAAKVIECLLCISKEDSELSMATVSTQRNILCVTYTESVYNEVVAILNSCKSRLITLVPCVAISPMSETNEEKSPHLLYTFTEGLGFKEWLEVADKTIWGFSVTNWGPNRVVVVGGEYGKGTGIFHKCVSVWDTLRKVWTRHGVQLPRRRHTSLAVIGNQLYIVGGVGAYRVILNSTLVYDLEERTYRKLVDLPDIMQSPAVCVHNDKLYVACEKEIFRYNDAGERDLWERVLTLGIRAHYLASFEGYIYVTQRYWNNLYRFRPDVDETHTPVVTFTYPVAVLCNVGTKLNAFNQHIYGQRELLSAEEYKDGQVRTMWSTQESGLRVNDVSGSCALVMDIPPVDPERSSYAMRTVAKVFPEEKS